MLVGGRDGKDGILMNGKENGKPNQTEKKCNDKNLRKVTVTSNFSFQNKAMNNPLSAKLTLNFNARRKDESCQC